MDPQLIICSKSSWSPSIRREHALAQLSAQAGVCVYFLERPGDIRELRGPGAGSWARALLRGATPVPHNKVLVVGSSVVIPGHQGWAAEHVASAALVRDLRRIGGLERSTVLANVPWQWPAISQSPAGRKVFDAADDWCEQIPNRRQRLLQLYAQIDQEADAITIASPALSRYFPSGKALLVPNGVGEEMLTDLQPRPFERKMTQAGTLSERFDERLAEQVLGASTEWTLDLYGQCQYAGCGDRPGPALVELLDKYPLQTSYHGVIERSELRLAIDCSSVTVIMSKPRFTVGQDSMKLYDYYARGRPVVSSIPAPPSTVADPPPHYLFARDVDGFIDALEVAHEEPPQHALDRRRWAERQTWSARWPSWSRCLFDELPTKSANS